MATVRVAADEWLIATHGSGHVLVTDGFSGCVGVVLVGNSKCLLSHVYSNCLLKTWRTYKPKIIEMLTAFKSGGETLCDSWLVHNDDFETETLLLLRGHLYMDFSRHPKVVKDRGCAVNSGAVKMVRRGRIPDPANPDRTVPNIVQTTDPMSFVPQAGSSYSTADGNYSSAVQHDPHVIGGMLNNASWPVSNQRD